MRILRLGALLTSYLLFAGCDARAASESVPVDSRHAATASREDELRGFRAGIARPPDGLRGGARSAEALVRAFLGAVEGRDSSAFPRLLLDRAEFAYLYYETSPLAAPPYGLGPDLMWFQRQGNSAAGLTRVLNRHGGRRLAYAGHRCDAPQRQGENLVHGNCIVRLLRTSGDTVSESLFGAIIERHGVYKFLSFSNRL